MSRRIDHVKFIFENPTRMQQYLLSADAQPLGCDRMHHVLEHQLGGVYPKIGYAHEAMVSAADFTILVLESEWVSLKHVLMAIHEAKLEFDTIDWANGSLPGEEDEFKCLEVFVCTDWASSQAALMSPDLEPAVIVMDFHFPTRQPHELYQLISGLSSSFEVPRILVLSHVDTVDSLQALVLKMEAAGNFVFSKRSMIRQIAPLIRSSIRSFGVQKCLKYASDMELNLYHAVIKSHALKTWVKTAIRHLRQHDIEKADALMEDMADFFDSLFKYMKSEVTLSEEQGFLRRFVGMLSPAPPNSASIDISVPADLLGARIPPMIFQPLVENAVIHGGNKGARPISIVIKFWVDPHSASLLRATIEDDGCGITGKPRSDSSTTKIKKLLNHLNAIRDGHGQYSLSPGITVLKGGRPAGTRFELSFPLKKPQKI